MEYIVSTGVRCVVRCVCVQLCEAKADRVALSLVSAAHAADDLATVTQVGVSRSL